MPEDPPSALMFSQHLVSRFLLSSEVKKKIKMVNEQW